MKFRLPSQNLSRGDSARLFLRPRVNEGHVELFTERPSFSQLRRSKDAKTLMIRRDGQVMAVVRIVFPIDARWFPSHDFGPGLQPTRLAISLSQDEWVRTLEREALAAL